MLRWKTLGLFVLTLLALLVAAGCGSDGDSGSTAGSTAGKSSGEPIKVGAVSSLSGPFAFPDSTRAAKAVFDRVNAEGGIDGHKIQYVVEDDGGQPQNAAQAARRLVDNENVVADVGSASLLECAVNAKLYSARNLLSIQGVATDPVCFNAPNISPVSAGLFGSIGIALQFAAQDLHQRQICTILSKQPGFGPAYAAVIGAFEQASGLKLVYDDQSFGGTDDPTPFIVKAKNAGCRAVVFTGLGPQAVAFMKSVQRQGLQDTITWITLAPAFTREIAAAMGSAGEGLYANSEYLPWSEPDAPGMSDWVSLMKASKIPPSSFAEGGYLSATIFVDALRKHWDGTVSRDAVAAALHQVTDYRTPLMGTPYSFAPAPRHQSNRASAMMRLRDGAWVRAAKGWVVVGG